MSDSDLYYRLGYNILKFRRKNSNYSSVYRDINIDNKNSVIIWAKGNLVPILSAEKEIISREEWDLDGLVGATEKQLLHPHFEITKKYIFEHYKPRFRTAVVMLCSNKKPYSTNYLINRYYELSKDMADFLIVSNPGVIPIEYDNYYPFRWYEWNELEETSEIKELYTKVIKDRIEEFFNYFKIYDSIISVIRLGETRDALLSANIKQSIYDLFSTENRKRLIKEHPKLDPAINPGIFKLRSLNISQGVYKEYLSKLKGIKQTSLGDFL